MLSGARVTVLSERVIAAVLAIGAATLLRYDGCHVAERGGYVGAI